MTSFNFVGRYSIYNLDLTVVDAEGGIVDADALPVATFKSWVDEVTIWTRTMTRLSLGTYRVTISSVESSDPGIFFLLSEYDLSGVPQVYRTDIEIPQTTSSLYESLTPEYREIVEAVWDRFEDLIDSPLGGPHLAAYTQSNFGRERVAQLLRIGMGVINTAAQPSASYSLDKDFPFDAWGPVLEQATVIEVIKHLMRSYVEQADVQGVQAARMDRRDYLSRWQQVLTIEQDTFRQQMQTFKMSHMGLGRAGVLVAGGIFPNVTPRIPGLRMRGGRSIW